MPYVEGRVVHDADSHVMETPGWFDDYVEEGLREKLEPYLPSRRALRGLSREELEERHATLEFREKSEENVMLGRNWLAAGSFRREDRPWALDLMGFSSQLVFTTAGLGPTLITDRSGDPELAYGFARAHNRSMVDFCSVDPRLLPVCWMPIGDIEAGAAFAKEALALGAAALMIPSLCPKTHSPSHIGLDAVWAQAQEAGIPIVFHVGGGQPMDNTYKENGLPPVPDFHGGDANFTSVSFMAIPYAPMQTLAVLILDGVLDRFPGLKLGIIEQGAAWLPGLMRMMDSSAGAFHKNEERLHALSLKPSEFVARQVRVTPYPHEPAGWIVKQTGPTVCLFSSDYPHVEGGRNPIKRFEASLDEEGCSPEEREAFYSGNFADLMGSAMDRVPQPSAA